MQKRIDIFLVESGKLKSRSQARMLIKQGDVYCNDQKEKKKGLLVSESDVIEIKQDYHFVSRGALKLVKAIESFNLDFKDKIIADCGASTGGFTQVSLIEGAKRVYAIDVGRDQLEASLLKDPRVINMPSVNLKNPLNLAEKVDFCVADLSFISIKKVFPNMLKLLKDEGLCVVLIKPQFEAGKERVGKNGIVKESAREEILEEVLAWFKSNGHKILSCIESPITGKSGNKEYLALIKGRQDSES